MSISTTAVRTQAISKTAETDRPIRKPLIGFIAAWAIFAAVLFLMPLPQGMNPMAKKVLAVMLWAITIWITEAMPAGAAGLVVPGLLVLSGAEPKLSKALSGFSEGVTILALIAFIFSAFMQLAGLDKRIALTIVQKVRASTVGRMVWGMFIANFAVSFLIPGSIARQGALLPVVNGLVRLFGDTPEERAAKKALVIHALTYACLITGIVVQTAHMPNLIMCGLFSKELNINVSYVDWFVMQCPILIMFLFTYLWTGVIFKHQKMKVPGGLEMINSEKEKLGATTKTEWTVLAVFALVALMWATEGWHRLQAPVVGLIFLSLFFMPGLFPFQWKPIQDKTIWGSWLMLGGAMCLSGAVSSSGLAAYIAGLAQPIAAGHHWMVILLVMIVATHIIRLGIFSNVAAISMIAPVMLAMGPQLGLHPIPFTLIVCNTDTFAYLLPTQTTAGVIAYSTGVFSFSDYAKVGIGAMIIAAAWDILFMSQWYAMLGYPIWQPLIR